MKTWEPVKDRIYELYIGQGLSLVQVREVLAREEGFEACTRSYRAQISKWGWLKNNHQHLINQIHHHHHHQQQHHNIHGLGTNGTNQVSNSRSIKSESNSISVTAAKLGNSIPNIIPPQQQQLQQQERLGQAGPILDMPHIDIDIVPSSGSSTSLGISTDGIGSSGASGVMNMAGTNHSTHNSPKLAHHQHMLPLPHAHGHQHYNPHASSPQRIHRHHGVNHNGVSSLPLQPQPQQRPPQYNNNNAATYLSSPANSSANQKMYGGGANGNGPLGAGVAGTSPLCDDGQDLDAKLIYAVKQQRQFPGYLPQQQQQQQQEAFVVPQGLGQNKRESVVVILDGRFRSSSIGSSPVTLEKYSQHLHPQQQCMMIPTVAEESEEDDYELNHPSDNNRIEDAEFRRPRANKHKVGGSQQHFRDREGGNNRDSSGAENDDDGDDDENDDERRRYVKRRRHRSLIDDEGVHEIRFDDSSSPSTSAGSSPRSGGAVDEEGEVVMVDAGVGRDDENGMVEEGGDEEDRQLRHGHGGHRHHHRHQHPRHMDVDGGREGDAARVLEEMKMYARNAAAAAGVKRFSSAQQHHAHSSTQGLARDKYLHVLNHKSPATSPRLAPHSPRIGGRSVISRVATPFQRMASPFVRATGEGNQVSGYLEVLETIPQPGAAQNLNSFSKITDWLLILTNGVSRSLPLHIVRAVNPPPPAPGTTSAAASTNPTTPPLHQQVRNLTILYHPQPPPGGNGSINLGTIPTVHAQDPNGRTTLHLAVKHRLPLEIIRLLISLGANVTTKDDQDVNCLHEALKLSPPPSAMAPGMGGRAEWTKTYLFPLLCELLNAAAAFPPSSTSSSAANTTATSSPDGVLPTESDATRAYVNEPMAWSSDSPLHLALRSNQDISVIKLLLNVGASATGVFDIFGASALHIVCMSLGPSTGTGTSGSSSASSTAAVTSDRAGKAAIVDLLLKNGAAKDVNTKTADGHTPLHYAVKALYAPSTPPPTTTTTISCSTPQIHSAGYAAAAAAFQDCCNVVEMLVGCGEADVSIRNGEGYGVAEMASLALAGRVEGAEAEDVGTGLGKVRLLGRIVRLLVKADRDRFLLREEERAVGPMSRR